jgi:hypothetical protein
MVAFVFSLICSRLIPGSARALFLAAIIVVMTARTGLTMAMILKAGAQRRGHSSYYSPWKPSEQTSMPLRIQNLHVPPARRSSFWVSYRNLHRRTRSHIKSGHVRASLGKTLERGGEARSNTTRVCRLRSGLLRVTTCYHSLTVGAILS